MFCLQFAFTALALLVGCLERGADCLHIVKLMPLHPKAHYLLPQLNPDWFYLSCTGLPRLCWKRGREMGVVAVTVVDFTPGLFSVDQSTRNLQLCLIGLML